MFDVSKLSCDGLLGEWVWLCYGLARKFWFVRLVRGVGEGTACWYMLQGAFVGSLLERACAVGAKVVFGIRGSITPGSPASKFIGGWSIVGDV